MTDHRPVDEREVYARILRLGARVSIVVLLLTFVLYLGGVGTPLIPISSLPRYWSLRAPEYLKAVGLEKGWGWMWLIGFADFQNFIGVALLAFLTILCYARILPIFVGRRDLAYALIVGAEIVLLLLAASGLLATGH
jgi:hypothetical protein